MKSNIKCDHTLTISGAVIWTISYLMLLLLTTSIDIFIWRKITGSISDFLNIGTVLIFSILFYCTAKQKTGFRLHILKNITIKGVCLAVGCSILFFLLLDNFLDPIFESFFKASEADYQDMLFSLKQSPVSSFLRVCVIAPITEELLMRAYILGGLQHKYRIISALIVSALLFALLHFNMVQTLSALICGLILGLLYLKTGSVFCCILSHFLYNTLSFIILIQSFSIS